MFCANSTRNRSRLRKLVCESLETRQLMAADLIHHNFMMPEDTDLNGGITPLDALVVINRLNSQNAAAPSELATAVDVDADGTLTPLDALTVINYFNRSVGEPEIQISQVNVQDRIERLDEALDSDLLPPNIDMAMAMQIREILQAGGFPEIGDRMVNGVMSRLGGDSLVSDPATDAVESISPGRGVDKSAGIDRSDFPELTDFLGELDSSERDFDFSGLDGLSSVIDPTNDNGNGYFLDAETAAPISKFVEIELRKQLKVGEDAKIRVAVSISSDEETFGTWIYWTEEGVGISGSWSYVTDEPETLNLFQSNADIEKRIYVQYPGSGFIYYSWLPNGPVGYFFSPIGNASEFESYFESVPGSIMNSIGGFTTFSGDLDVFEGIAPIEDQVSALFAIDRAGRE
jgi:hypothetical protein